MEKIQIKSIDGKILFDNEKENFNTIKDAVVEAVKSKADLSKADLSGADLQEADLRQVDLHMANLYMANLYMANLSKANLYMANLSKADLRQANLQQANLYMANLSKANLNTANIVKANLSKADLSGAIMSGLIIKKAIVFHDLYKYVVIPFISDSGDKYVKMGCFVRTIEEWEKDFWNNNTEFPNDGSEKSNARLFAFQTAKKWFETIKI